MKFAYYHFVFIQAVCGLLRRWGILKWDVRGIADLPPAGTPFVLVVNHIKWHDILVVAGSIPLTHIPYWLAKAELFTPVTRWWFRGMQAIPVRRGQNDTGAIDSAVASLHAGHIMIVFPEGHRSGNGKLQKGRGGAVRMALRAGVPIVPVGMHGVEHGITAPVTITYGKAWQPVSASGVINIDPVEMTALTDTMMCHIAALIPSTHHGYYAAQVNATDRP
jgi:1-acyl-sn-glycerol-3-phosphate acyltransferase